MKVEFLTAEDIRPLFSKVDEVLSLLRTSPPGREQTGMIYSNKQLSKKINVSLKTLQNYRDSRMIEFNQVGRKICYTENQVQKFLERFKVKTSKSILN